MINKFILFLLFGALTYVAVATGEEKPVTYAMTTCDGKTCKVKKERYKTLKECEDAKAVDQLCTSDELKCIKY